MVEQVSFCPDTSCEDNKNNVIETTPPLPRICDRCGGPMSVSDVDEDSILGDYGKKKLGSS